MGWADELYENEPGLAPVRQEGGHVIGAIAKFLGLGPALEGNWSGQAEGTQSPMYGRKWGEAPIADILGNIDLPAKGAMAALPAIAGFTQITGRKGGQRIINAFHDKTKALLGSLGYEDLPNMPIFQFLQSEKPRATHEMLNTFVNEMGPRMNNVRVQPPIVPEAVPSFESWVKRGRLDQWPDLKRNLQSVLDETKLTRPMEIPSNTYANQKQTGYSGLFDDIDDEVLNSVNQQRSVDEYMKQLRSLYK